MPLFFFDISDGTRETDLDGSECVSLDAARSQAIRFAGELLQQHAQMIWDGHDLRVEVLDAKRTPLFAVVTSAVSLFPPP